MELNHFVSVSFIPAEWIQRFNGHTGICIQMGFAGNILLSACPSFSDQNLSRSNVPEQCTELRAADAGILSKTESAEGAQQARQHLQEEWKGNVLGWGAFFRLNGTRGFVPTPPLFTSFFSPLLELV